VPLAQIYGANMAFKRDLFAELGEFDIGLGPTGEKLYRHEESDFVTRAVAREKKLFYDPNIIVWHNISQERMRKNYFRKWYFDDGENKGLRFEGVSGRNLFGIPLWYMRITGVNFIKWIRSFFKKGSNPFLAELELWEDLGFYQGRLRSVLALRRKRNRRLEKIGIR
jgi:GT2 family glycosyltransferase